MRARRTGLILTAAVGAAFAAVVARRSTRAPQPQVRTGTFSNGIEYSAVGAGPRTMIFLPGGPGTVPFAGIWARVGVGMFRLLADAGFTVWRLSRRRNMPPGHTMADMADDVADVIDEGFGGHVDVVVGLSYGGPIALFLAARHPDAVGRVALVASSAAITDKGRQLDRRYGEALADGRFTEAAEALLEELLPPGRPQRRAKRLVAPLVGRVLAASGYNLPDVLVETRAEMDLDARPVLHQITAPVLIIAGDQDIFVTREIVEESTRLIPDCTVVRYAGRSHGGTASDKRVPGDILAFVNRDSGRVRGLV
jgi:pimeloyl-ACP methyl ester carboxylesterase